MKTPPPAIMVGTLLFCVGCDINQGGASAYTDRDILGFVSDINAEPEVPHSEFSEASRKLIAIGPRSVPFLVVAYKTGSPDTRERACIAMVQIAKTACDRDRDGELSKNEDAEYLDTIASLGTPDPIDEPTLRNERGILWCQWADAVRENK